MNNIEEVINTIIGYARVSTADKQNIENQIQSLQAYGCELIFQDKESGTHKIREGFENMKSHLRPNDTVVVTELSRAGRVLINVLDFVDYLKSMNVNFVSLKENIDINSPSGIMALQIFGSVSQFEKSRLVERTRESIHNARLRGVRLGRPPLETAKLEKAYKLYINKDNNGLSTVEICKMCEVNRSSLYRYINTHNKKSI